MAGKAKRNAGWSQVGSPVVVDYPNGTDEQDVTMCYSCFNNLESHGVMSWVPDVADNFPRECAVCGLTMLHETQED